MDNIEKIKNSQKISEKFGKICLDAIYSEFFKYKQYDEIPDHGIERLGELSDLLDFVKKSALLESGVNFLKENKDFTISCRDIFEEYKIGIKNNDKNIISSFILYCKESFSNKFLISHYQR